MKTEILFILDRSGSMAACQEDAVGGFNQFLKDQKKNPKGKRLTLLQFDHLVEHTYDSAPLNKCKKLVLGETYKPRGMTALLDAIGAGLDKLGDSKKAIVAIYTDGMENASKEWSLKSVRKLLDKSREDGWEVLFLASGLDSAKAVRWARADLGFGGLSAAQFDPAHMAAATQTFSTRVTNYVNTGEASKDNLQDEYDKSASK